MNYGISYFSKMRYFGHFLVLSPKSNITFLRLLFSASPKMHMTFRHLLLTHTAEFFGIIWCVLLWIGSGSEKSIFVCLSEVRAAVGLTDFLITDFTSWGACFNRGSCPACRAALCIIFDGLSLIFVAFCTSGCSYTNKPHHTAIYERL